MFFYEFERISECRNDDKPGACIISEIFDPSFGVHAFSSYIKGLGWPVAIFSDGNDEKETIVHSFEELESTGIGVAYKCYVVSMRSGLRTEASLIAKAINKSRSLSPDLNLIHEDFLLHTSNTILNRIDTELHGDYQLYFDSVCGKAVKNIKQAINDEAYF